MTRRERAHALLTELELECAPRGAQRHDYDCDLIAAALEQARDEALEEADRELGRVYAIIATLDGRAAMWIPTDDAHRAITALRGRVAESARKEGT